MKFWSNSEIPPQGSSVPEKRLLAAVLQRAITDYLTADGELREGARVWLFDDEPTDAPLSFRFICEALDLDAGSLRDAISAQAQAAVNSGLLNAVNGSVAVGSANTSDSRIIGSGAATEALI